MMDTNQDYQEYDVNTFLRDLLELISTGRVVPAWYRGTLRYYAPGYPLPKGARRADIIDVIADIIRKQKELRDEQL